MKSTLLMIPPAPVQEPEPGRVVLDKKFDEGMVLHCGHWPGQVHCILRRKARDIPFGAEFARQDLGFRLSVIDADAAVPESAIEGGARVGYPRGRASAVFGRYAAGTRYVAQNSSGDASQAGICARKHAGYAFANRVARSGPRGFAQALRVSPPACRRTAAPSGDPGGRWSAGQWLSGA